MPDVISHLPHPCLEGSNCCRGKGWSPAGETLQFAWSCWYILFPRVNPPHPPTSSCSPSTSKWMKGLPLTFLFPVLILSQLVRSIFPLELLTFWVLFLDQGKKQEKKRCRYSGPKYVCPLEFQREPDCPQGPLGRAHSMSPWLEHLLGQHLTTQIAGGSESTSPKSAGIHPPGTYILKCHL